MTHDPFLSHRQHRDVLGAYVDAEAFTLGWPARAALAVAAMLVGAGCGTIVVFSGAWRRLLG